MLIIKGTSHSPDLYFYKSFLNNIKFLTNKLFRYNSFIFNKKNRILFAK